MAIDFQAIRDANLVSDVAASRMKLERSGVEFKALCPFHLEKTPSFTINDDKQFYHCYGCGAHGDVIDLVQNLHKVTTAEAVKILGGAPSPEIVAAARLRKDKADYYAGIIPLIMPEEVIPVVGQWFKCWNPKNNGVASYKPNMVFPYRNAAGECLGVVIRQDFKDGGKITPLLRWCRMPDGEIKLTHMIWQKARPWYGLHRRTEETKQVLIVEGEKCADAAHRLFGGAPLAISWPGGDTQGAKADWSALAGLSVLLWPDADPGGWKAMQEAAVLARDAGAREVILLEWDRTQERGWDIARAVEQGWDKERVSDWIRSHIVQEDDVPLAEMEGYEGHDLPPPDEQKKWPFRLLGHNRGKYYYQPRGTQQIIEMEAREHTQTNLLSLAPLDYWEGAYEGKGSQAKFDIAYAVNALFRASETVGIFSSARLRGRGAWIDDGRSVMHLGSTVYIGDEEFSPYDVKSQFIYEQAEPMHVKRVSPATNKEAHRLVQICERITWEDPLSAQILAGWCVIAPVCGVLKWRPHIWVTGSKGSGKSTVTDHIIEKIVGAVAVKAHGGSTEPGIRQVLYQDARPVIVDEFESEEKIQSDDVQKLLSFARISSSGGRIYKGSSSGEAMRFEVRSCFCFSSINTSVKQGADEDRINMLVLNKNESEDRTEHYEKIMIDINNWFTENYAAAMFSRTVKHMATLLDNIETFRKAGSIVFGSQRTADQIGPLLAGVYLCHGTGLIKLPTAIEWIKSHNWEEQINSESTTDEKKLLRKIASAPRTIDTSSGPKRSTIGEMIEKVSKREDDGNIPLEGMIKDLARIGIKVFAPWDVGNDRDEAIFLVANQSDVLSKILEGTPWNKNWKRPLRTLGGADSKVDVTFFSPGLNQRATRLCVSLLRGE